MPLTDDTRGIIDATLLKGLARDGRLGGPVLLNAGRGGLQGRGRHPRARWIAGALKGASLDVFQTEPLTGDSPLWNPPPPSW